MSSLAGSNSPSSSASEGDRGTFKGGKEGTWGEKTDSSGNEERRGDFDRTGAYHSGNTTLVAFVMSNSPTNRTRQGPSWSCTALDSLSSSTGRGCQGKRRHSGSFSTSTRPCRVIMCPSASSRISVGIPETRGGVKPIGERKSWKVCFHEVCHSVFTSDIPACFHHQVQKVQNAGGKNSSHSLQER